MMEPEAARQREARIRGYYNRKPERDRLAAGSGRLEFERSKALISRYLPATTTDILDVGGGTGSYSFWLASLGHRVSFIDLSDEHVSIVRAKNRDLSSGLVSVREGSALSIGHPDASFDMVLNMGPLYHLTAEERPRALQEMGRVLRRGGLVVSAYISRFAALMDGYQDGYIEDPVFPPLAVGDVTSGTHDSPDETRYFTLAYMHRPDEVQPELEAGGLRMLDLFAVEGLFWTSPRLDRYLSEKAGFERLLAHAELLEKEPSIMGASAHFLSIATPI
jgi:SAM-dependent methyltransferase